MNIQTWCEIERNIASPAPSQSTGEPMYSNTQYRKELFSKTNKRDIIEVLKQWSFESGLFANMSDDEKQSFRRFIERCG